MIPTLTLNPLNRKNSTPIRPSERLADMSLKSPIAALWSLDFERRNEYEASEPPEARDSAVF